MDIAALSVAMSSASTQQAVQISMLRKSMDQQESQVQTLVQDMMASTPPAEARLLDMRV